MGLIAEILKLRKESTDSVATLDLTTLQRELYVRAPYEDEVVGLVQRSIEDIRAGDTTDLIVVTGNAGDGKTDLMARVRERVGDHPKVLWNEDATHADTGTREQVQHMADFLSPYNDHTNAKPNGLRFLAANVGMLLWLFEQFRALNYPFTNLENHVLHYLGLGDVKELPNTPYTITVINLNDRPGILLRGYGGFARRLIEKAANYFRELSDAQCNGCPVASWCFVRSNLYMLSNKEVLDGLEDCLRKGVLESQGHLTARDILDFFAKLVTGKDRALFMNFDEPCRAIYDLAERQDEAELRARMFPNTAFSGDGGRVFEMLLPVDPALSEGVNVTDYLMKLYIDPTAVVYALQASYELSGAEVLATLASRIVEGRSDWFNDASGDDVRRTYAYMAVRLAYFLRNPEELSSDFEDDILNDFLSVLQAYLQASMARRAPEMDRSVIDTMQGFRQTVVSAIRKIFGARIGGEDFVAANPFRGSQVYQLFVPVGGLDAKVRVEPDPKLKQGIVPFWEALEYQPLSVRVGIGGEQRYIVPVGLRLYRLFRLSEAGFSAPTVDLQGFYALRAACERLAALASRNRVVFRTSVGKMFDVRESVDPFGEKEIRIELALGVS